MSATTPFVVHVIHREVLLADHRTALGTDDVTNLLVHRVRPDVVGGRHVERLRPGVSHQPGEEWFDLLRRHRTGAEDQRVTLLALVLLRVDVQRVALLDRRALDGLASGAVDAAEDDVDLLLLDELGGGGFRRSVFRRAVLDEQLDRMAEEAALRVDVIDHHLGDVRVGDAHERECAPFDR